MRIAYSWSTEDGKGSGGSDSAERHGEGITLEMVQKIEAMLKPLRDKIDLILQGK